MEPKAMSIRWTLRTVLWLGCLMSAFVVTHLPPSRIPSRGVFNDKVMHLTGFTALGLVTVWRLGSERHPIGTRRFLAWFTVLIVYAVVDEMTQPMIGRSCELGDWLADACGAALGMGVGLLFRRVAARRHG